MDLLSNIVKIWIKFYPVFLEGLAGTVLISLLTIAAGLVLGIIVCILRMSKIKVLNMICVAYIEVIRGTPILLQLYFFWLWLPKVTGVDLTNLFCILIALIVNAGAYISENIRAGIQAVDIGQTEAARSLGMTELHCMFKIVLPQAIKNILPALGNEFISMIKSTSLASTFFISELTTSFRTVQASTYMPIPPLIISGIIYFVVTFTLTRLIKIWETRLKQSD